MSRHGIVGISATALGLWMTAAAGAQNQRLQAVLGDKARLDADASWVYNDLERGQDAAAESHKPMLVVIRCVP